MGRAKSNAWVVFMDDKQKNREIGEELLKISKAKYKSAQDKYNAIQALAKKYDIPLEKLMKNIIMEWMYEDKENKFSSKKGKKDGK